MQLKDYVDVHWQDLPKIESPALARAWLESHAPLTDHTLYGVQGLDGALGDPLHLESQHWDEHARDRLLDRIDRGEVLLIHGFHSDPMDPVVRRSDGESAWHITASLSLETRHHVERMIAHASETRGIWQPILTPQEQAPAPEPEPREEPEELTVTNPRWEHVDQNLAEESPEVAADGDTIRLLVDVSGAPESSRVTFRIFDTSFDPPARVGVARGEVEGGVGSGEWNVKVRRRGGTLEFEGAVRRVGSERAKIPLLAEFAFST